MKTEMTLRYAYPAPLDRELISHGCDGGAWEKYSMPLGNGFFGANVFGRTETERLQISEPSLANPYKTPKTVKRIACSAAGVNSLAEIFIEHVAAQKIFLGGRFVRRAYTQVKMWLVLLL